jgi:hypothetical protein
MKAALAWLLVEGCLLDLLLLLLVGAVGLALLLLAAHRPISYRSLDRP